MYSSLDSARTEIRLLDLDPGAWNDEIRCQLRIATLQDQPSFKALSYVWGDLGNKAHITVNDASFATTQNLFTGLQRLRDPRNILTLWVDAVCINQASVDERNQQVKLMGEIYGSADEVLIWLGYGGMARAPQKTPHIYRWAGDDTDSRHVCSYFEQCQDREEEQGDAQDILGAFVYLSLRASDQHLKDMLFFNVEGAKLHARSAWLRTVRALDILREVPWWRRTWTFQEAVLARKATVTYSNMDAPWDMLARAASLSQVHDSFCCEDSLNTRPIEEEMVLVGIRRAIYDDIELVRSARAQNARLSLDQLMSQTRHRHATDVRDKVYGVVGMVTNWLSLPPLSPDYNLEPQEVFMQASFSELAGSRSLQGLMGVTRVDVPNLPSWVTQTSSPEAPVQQLRIIRASLFSAAGPSLADVGRKGDVLVVGALEQIDTVADVGCVMFKGSGPWRELIDVLQQWHHMARLHGMKSSSYTEQSWEEAFWRIVVNDCIGWHPRERASAQNVESGIVRSIFRRLRDTDLASLPEDWWRWLQVQPQGSGSEHNEGFGSDMDSIRLFQESCLGATALRRFFVTASGRMGLGPSSLLVGDAVRVLLGGDTLFATRKVVDSVESHDTLVGDVYVQGLMDGEGMPTDWKEQITRVELI